MVSRCFLAFIIVLITACGGSNNDVGTPVDEIPPNSSAFTIEVIARNGFPITESSITIGDKEATITTGRAEFAELAAGEVRGIVRVPGFVSGNVFTAVVEGKNIVAKVVLLPVRCISYFCC